MKIQEHTLPRPAGLIECDTVLDVGTGIRPMQWYQPLHHVCVEPYGPYCDVLRDGGYLCFQTTAQLALGHLDADAVYLLDVIEHMRRRVGNIVVRMAQRRARKQVVIFTPMGFVEQTSDSWGMGGDRWQTHRSGWRPEDFPGWECETFDVGFFAVWNR